MSKLTQIAAQIPGLRTLDQLTIADAWLALRDKPLGKQAFAQLIKLRIPYSGSIGAVVQELSDGHAVVTLQDRRAVRNHLDCIHAVALLNLGELATGLAVFHALDGKAKGIVTDLQIQFHKKARGTLTARCDVDVPMVTAPQAFSVEGQICDAKGELVSTVRATWTLRPL
jgi:acyl-coenzyme A thioesterase PaaI-like protein